MQLAAGSDLEEAAERWDIWDDKGGGERHWHKADVINLKLKRLLLEAVAEDPEGLGDEVYMWYCGGVEHWDR